MKRSILNKLFIVLFAITFLSCENAIQQGSGNNNTKEGKKTAYVCVKNAGLSEASRTALPTFNSRELTNLVLMGYSGGSNQQLATADSLDELSSKLIEIEEGKWSFSLYAELNGVEFSGDTAATAYNGQTLSLAFVLQPSSVSNKGWFSITVAFEGEADSSTGVIYDLWNSNRYYYYFNGNNVDSGNQNERHEIELEIQQNSNGQKYVTFAFPINSDYAMYTGNYRAEVALFNKGTSLNTYSTSVIIAGGLVSKATAFISLSNSYTITFHNLEDGEFLTAVRGAYTNKDTGTITLPAEIKRVGYKFLGWYDNENLSGDPVTEFTITTYENKDFWAKWETLDPATLYVSADGTGDGSSATNALGSLQAAVDKIINFCDPDDDSYDNNAINTRYTIKVDGMLSGSIQTLDGSLNVGSLTIEGKNAPNAGIPQDVISGALEINIEGTSVTLKNIGITATSGSALYVGDSDTVTKVVLDDGTVIGYANTNSESGGGLSIAPKASVTMKEGSKISNNTAKYGGGVFVASNATFKMTGGEISGNQGEKGAGVYVYEDGIFEMTGGNISDNTATADGGGVWSNGETTLKGGEISGNTAKNGAGIYKCYNYVTMSDGKISNNTATYGGGIYNYDGGTFSLTGGEIFDNTASFGSGLYNGGVFELSENAQIDSSNDVYFTTSRELTIAGPLNKSPVATITPLAYEENSNNKMLELKEVGFNSLSGQTYYITTTSIAAEASKFSIVQQTTDEDGDPIKQPRTWHVQADGTIHTDDPLLSDYERLLLGSELNSSNLSTTKASLEAGKQYKFVLDEYYASNITSLMSLLKPASSNPVIFGESIVNLSKIDEWYISSSNFSGYYYHYNSWNANNNSFSNNITKVVLPKEVTLGQYGTNVTVNVFRDVQATLKEIAIAPGYNSSELDIYNGALIIKNYSDNGKSYLYCYPSQREGTSYTIPLGVTCVFDSAFYKNEKLTTINGLSSVRTIGGSVFEETTGLETIDLSGVTTFLPAAGTYSPNLFKNSKVKKVILPNTDFVMGVGWFIGCTELEEVEFKSSNPPKLDMDSDYNQGNNVFFEKTGTNAIGTNFIIRVPEGAVENYISATGTESGAFHFAHTTNNRLFWNGTVYITDGNVVAVGGGRVADAIANGNTTITLCGYVSSSTECYDWSVVNTAINESENPINLVISNMQSSSDVGANLAGNTKLASITLPPYYSSSSSPVTSVAAGAFTGCTNLTTVEMPSTVTTIGTGAFSGCTSLTTVKIGGAEVTDVTGWKDDTDTQIVLADGQTFAQYLQTCTSELKKN